MFYKILCRINVKSTFVVHININFELNFRSKTKFFFEKQTSLIGKSWLNNLILIILSKL